MLISRLEGREVEPPRDTFMKGFGNLYSFCITKTIPAFGLLLKEKLHLVMHIECKSIINPSQLFFSTKKNQLAIVGDEIVDHPPGPTAGGDGARHPGGPRLQDKGQEQGQGIE